MALPDDASRTVGLQPSTRAKPLRRDKDGKKIPALAQTGKIGWMFILDRLTGKPVFGIEERPVAKGDVPTRMVCADATIPREASRSNAREHDGR